VKELALASFAAASDSHVVAEPRSARFAAFEERFDARAELARLAALGFRFVARSDPAFPTLLRAIHDPPPGLFLRGGAELDVLSRAAVAVVGARACSAYGRQVARSHGRELGAAGLVVVSGLALGIDAAAHRGCLDAGGTALGVLAGGADVPYPRRSAGLYSRITAGGAVVSELPPGQRAYRWAFPARNRIMAGLSAVVVVVEAADPSGSLITSTFAGQLGRTVAAVPGRVTSRFSAGSNGLLKDGALVVTSARDILDGLYGAGVSPPAAVEAAAHTEAAGPTHTTLRDPVEQRALDAVEAGLGIDALCAHSGLPAREARALLARLESSGHLRRDGLGGYRRSAAFGR
jgi:DNA processing protein